MASTNTSANSNAESHTYSRSVALRNQFSYAFNMIMGHSYPTTKAILAAIREQKIVSVSFCAYTLSDKGKRQDWLELILAVDWNKHSQLLEYEHSTVHIRGSWFGCTSLTYSAVNTFNDEVRDNHLDVVFYIDFSPSLSEIECANLMRSLNLTPEGHHEWAGEKETLYDIPSHELEEFRCTMNSRK